MVDPRLNSIHLEALPRRQDFRRAREQLLGARGQQTLSAEQSQQLAELPEKSPTLIRAESAPPTTSKFVLMDKDYVYPLKIGLNTVGRMPDNDVVIQDACISRRHCAILIHAANGCELHDVASKNGTFINGQRITGPTRLTSGDEIGMCNRQFIFVTRDDAQPVVPPRDDSQTYCE
jgi:pSer/pThr/pTyr-binding forkhead associated (FHA) protein